MNSNIYLKVLDKQFLEEMAVQARAKWRSIFRKSKYCDIWPIFCRSVMKKTVRDGEIGEVGPPVRLLAEEERGALRELAILSALLELDVRENHPEQKIVKHKIAQVNP